MIDINLILLIIALSLILVAAMTYILIHIFYPSDGDRDYDDEDIPYWPGRDSVVYPPSPPDDGSVPPLPPPSKPIPIPKRKQSNDTWPFV